MRYLMARTYGRRFVRRRVFLVGMPLSGKSTLGPLLAERLGWTFYELDGLVSEAMGFSSVAKAFAARGEAAFRRTERAVLAPFLTKAPPFVLATGGGAPCYGEQMAKLCAAGDTIYLKLPWHKVAERASGSLFERPLLARWLEGGPGLLEEAWTARLPYYEQAQLHFSVGNDSVKATAARLFFAYTQNFSNTA